MTDPTTDSVRIPPLTSRTWRRWVVATGAAVVVAVGWVMASQPENRLIGAIVLVGAATAVTVALRSSTWLEPDAGAVVRVRARLLRRRVPLDGGTRAELVPNGGGMLLLGLRPEGSRRRMFVPVLALTDYVEQSQPAPVLRALADALERHGVARASAVARQLRLQATDIEAGGDPRTSPLAPLVTHGVMRAAKAGGAGAAGGNLLG